jgi:hypothetical protein
MAFLSVSVTSWLVLQRKVAILSLFWMQLDCILLAVQLLANGKSPDFAL